MINTNHHDLTERRERGGGCWPALVRPAPHPCAFLPPSCVTYYAITPLCLVGQGVPLWNPRYCDTSRFSLLLRCNAPHRYCDPSQFPVTVTPPPAPLGIRPVTVIVLPLLCLIMGLNRVLPPPSRYCDMSRFPLLLRCNALPVTVTSRFTLLLLRNARPLFLAYAPRCPSEPRPLATRQSLTR